MGRKVQIHDCFDIAISHGHNAMDHLHAAFSQERLNSTHAQPAEAGDLVAIGNLHFGQKQLFKELTSTVVLFQAMMEAIINYSLEEFSQLQHVGSDNFASKWKDSLAAVGEDSREFDSYLTGIYRPIRNALIHPAPSKLPGLQSMTLTIVHSGLKSGWLAYRDLFRGVGRPHDNDSWEVLCSAHQVPHTL